MTEAEYLSMSCSEIKSVFDTHFHIWAKQRMEAVFVKAIGCYATVATMQLCAWIFTFR